MAKEAKIKIEGGVVLKVNHDVYEVELPNKAIIRAQIAGRMRMHSIRILPGDKVTVEMSPYDLKTGQITYRNSK